MGIADQGLLTLEQFRRWWGQSSASLRICFKLRHRIGPSREGRRRGQAVGCHRFHGVLAPYGAPQLAVTHQGSTLLQASISGFTVQLAPWDIPATDESIPASLFSSRLLDS
jgi:hypothetical protein